MKRVVHAACPHDCPDACGTLITVEDGRATRIQGDPAHPVTQGFLCAKVAKYLDRVYSPDRVLYPMRRVAPKGVGGAEAFRRISWDEALNEIVARLKQISAEFGTGGRSALLLRRQPGSAERRLDGHAVLPSYGRIAVTTDHLRHHGRRRHRVDLRAQGWHRAGTVPPLEVHHRVGREHSRQQCAPVAVCRGGAAQWREAGGDRSLPHAHGKGCRLAHSDQSGHRRCAGDGADAHHRARRPARSRITSRATPRASTSCRSGCRSTRRSRFRSGRDIRKTTLNVLAREYATSRPAVIRVNYGIQRTPERWRGVRAVCMLPVITGSWKEVGGGLQLSLSGGFGLNQSALERTDLMLNSPLGRVGAQHQHGGAGQGANRGQRSSGEGTVCLQLAIRRRCAPSTILWCAG